MKKLSYNVIFNNINPNGFAKDDTGFLNSPDSDVWMIDNMMTALIHAFDDPNIVTITRTNISDYKITYKIVYNGDWIFFDLKDVDYMNQLCNLYTDYICHNFSAIKFKDSQILLSVDYSNLRTIEGYYSCVIQTISKNDSLDIINDFNLNFNKDKLFGDTIYAKIKYKDSIGMYIDNDKVSINGHFTVMETNSPLVALTHFRKNKDHLPDTICGKPTITGILTKFYQANRYI